MDKGPEKEGVVGRNTGNELEGKDFCGQVPIRLRPTLTQNKRVILGLSD